MGGSIKQYMEQHGLEWYYFGPGIEEVGSGMVVVEVQTYVEYAKEKGVENERQIIEKQYSVIRIKDLERFQKQTGIKRPLKELMEKSQAGHVKMYWSFQDDMFQFVYDKERLFNKVKNDNTFIKNHFPGFSIKELHDPAHKKQNISDMRLKREIRQVIIEAEEKVKQIIAQIETQILDGYLKR